MAPVHVKHQIPFDILRGRELGIDWGRSVNVCCSDGSSHRLLLSRLGHYPTLLMQIRRNPDNFQQPPSVAPPTCWAEARRFDLLGWANTASGQSTPLELGAPQDVMTAVDSWAVKGTDRDLSFSELATTSATGSQAFAWEQELVAALGPQSFCNLLVYAPVIQLYRLADVACLEMASRLAATAPEALIADVRWFSAAGERSSFSASPAAARDELRDVLMAERSACGVEVDVEVDDAGPVGTADGSGGAKKRKSDDGGRPAAKRSRTSTGVQSAPTPTEAAEAAEAAATTLGSGVALDAIAPGSLIFALPPILVSEVLRAGRQPAPVPVLVVLGTSCPEMRSLVLDPQLWLHWLHTLATPKPFLFPEFRPETGALAIFLGKLVDVGVALDASDDSDRFAPAPQHTKPTTLLSVLRRVSNTLLCESMQVEKMTSRVPSVLRALSVGPEALWDNKNREDMFESLGEIGRIPRRQVRQLLAHETVVRHHFYDPLHDTFTPDPLTRLHELQTSPSAYWSSLLKTEVLVCIDRYPSVWKHVDVRASVEICNQSVETIGDLLTWSAPSGLPGAEPAKVADLSITALETVAQRGPPRLLEIFISGVVAYADTQPRPSVPARAVRVGDLRRLLCCVVQRGEPDVLMRALQAANRRSDTNSTTWARMVQGDGNMPLYACLFSNCDTVEMVDCLLSQAVQDLVPGPVELCQRAVVDLFTRCLRTKAVFPRRDAEENPINPHRTIRGPDVECITHVMTHPSIVMSDLLRASIHREVLIHLIPDPAIINDCARLDRYDANEQREAAAAGLACLLMLGPPGPWWTGRFLDRNNKEHQPAVNRLVQLGILRAWPSDGAPYEFSLHGDQDRREADAWIAAHGSQLMTDSLLLVRGYENPHDVPTSMIKWRIGPALGELRARPVLQPRLLTEAVCLGDIERVYLLLWPANADADAHVDVHVRDIAHTRADAIASIDGADASLNNSGLLRGYLTGDENCTGKTPLSAQDERSLIFALVDFHLKSRAARLFDGHPSVFRWLLEERHSSGSHSRAHNIVLFAIILGADPAGLARMAQKQRLSYPEEPDFVTFRNAVRDLGLDPDTDVTTARVWSNWIIGDADMRSQSLLPEAVPGIRAVRAGMKAAAAAAAVNTVSVLAPVGAPLGGTDEMPAVVAAADADAPDEAGDSSGV